MRRNNADRWLWGILGAAILATAAIAWAQRTPLPPSVDRRGVPEWELDNEMPRDVFTFVRIRYGSYNGRGGKWATDYPDADLNLAYRLKEMTSLKVHPEGKVLELTDPELFNYPFAYMAEPGDLWFSDDEVKALRKHLSRRGQGEQRQG